MADTQTADIVTADPRTAGARTPEAAPAAALPGPTRRLRRAASREPAVRVLLLHGMGLTGSAWDTFVAGAAPNLELWEADLPWTRNGAPDWVEHADIGQWVAQAMEPPGTEPGGTSGFFHAIVAHSFSATAVLNMLDQAEATGVASALRAIVLTAPFFRSEQSHFDLDTLRYSLHNFPLLFQEGIQVQSAKRIPPEILEAMAARVCELLGPRVWLRFSDAYLRTPQLRPDTITTPVLLIVGERDLAAAPTDSEALDKALPDSRLEILEGCGHFPMIEQPERFSALLGGFLAERA